MSQDSRATLSRNWNCYGTFNIFIEGERAIHSRNPSNQAPEPVDANLSGWEEALRKARMRFERGEAEGADAWPPREPNVPPRESRVHQPTPSSFGQAHAHAPCGYSGFPASRGGCSSCPPSMSSFGPPGGSLLHPPSGAPTGPRGASVFSPPSASVFESPSLPIASQQGPSISRQPCPPTAKEYHGPIFGQPAGPRSFGPIRGPLLHPPGSFALGSESVFGQARPSKDVQPQHATVKSVSDDS